jgi:hypothetical protein
MFAGARYGTKCYLVRNGGFFFLFFFWFPSNVVFTVSQEFFEVGEWGYIVVYLIKSYV